MPRAVALALGVFGLLSIGAPALAQDYPSRPVTMIVPWPAGGSSDLAMRALADATRKHLGQPFVIENRSGAAGTLGPAQMANAKPDGYTISQMPISVYRLPFMTKTTYDPTKDFTYIIGLTGYTFGVVVRKDAPWKTFREFLDYAKANPGKINYGTPGTGTSLHVTMEQIARREGIKWTHVPFKGVAENTASLLGGHIDAVADSTGWAALVNSGEFRLLVTWTSARTRNWPNVPTLAETGFNLVANSPYGLAGPKGMDPKVVARLHDAFKKGLAEESYKDALIKFDQELVYMNTEQYHAHAMQQIAEGKQLIEELGLGAK